MDRRHLLWGGAGVLALAAASRVVAGSGKSTRPETFEVARSDVEWRERLSPAQYAVLRQEGTERPYSSPLNNEKRPGTFDCAGCDMPLFSSSTKFDSHTGWPSF